MARLKIIQILSIVIWMLLATLVEAAEVYPSNTPSLPPVSSKSYPLPLTLNAKRASIQTTSVMVYHLTLHDVFNKVTYKNNLLSLNKLIMLWKSKKHQAIEADVTGIQVNSRTVGHVQFHAHAVLYKPQYNAKQAELSFGEVYFTTPVAIQDEAYLDNVTVFINGCGLCICGQGEVADSGCVLNLK